MLKPNRSSMFDCAARIKALPPYLFVEIDRAKREALSRGVDVIDFGIGDPDLPTPKFIIQALGRALKDKSTHQYPLDRGRPSFREAIAKWYQKRFNVTLNPETEVLPLIGSKEGITHIPLAFVDKGDSVWLPDPGYPAYRGGVLFAGGTPEKMPLNPKTDFLPDWDALSRQVPSRLRMLYLNYPSNPTASVATPETFEGAVRFAQKHGVIICHDNAYSEIYFDRQKPLSFLETDGAKTVGVEFHSLSKTFNMTGWRLGFVCGNAQVIAALAKLKSNIDSGVFSAIQIAGEKALLNSSKVTRGLNAIYLKRRNLLVEGLKALGIKTKAPKATFYVWSHVPRGEKSMDFCKRLLDRAGIVATPGAGFGSGGEGYFRMTLTVPEKRIRRALKRLGDVL